MIIEYSFYFQYMLSRYFSSEVAIEQLTWLIKGCGTNYLPVGFFNDKNSFDISSISFPAFNRVCKIIDPNERSGLYYERFLACIENIKNGFEYPQYYNGLIGLLLLFSYDETYYFNDPTRIKKTFEETKRVVMTGYETFKEFGSDAIDSLISTIREMSDIFEIIHGTNLSFYREETQESENVEMVCYVNEEGKRIQIKPLNYSSKRELKRRNQDPFLKASQSLAIKNNEFHSTEQIMRSYQKFEQIFSGITSGYVLTTVIGKFQICIISC